MSALRDRIIEKTIEFRDKSKSLSELIPKQVFDNKPNREEIDKKLQAQKVQDGVKEIQDIAYEHQVDDYLASLLYASKI